MPTAPNQVAGFSMTGNRTNPPTAASIVSVPIMINQLSGTDQNFNGDTLVGFGGGTFAVYYDPAVFFLTPGATPSDPSKR